MSKLIKKYIKGFFLTLGVLFPLLFFGTDNYYATLFIAPLLYLVCNRWLFFLLLIYFLLIDIILIHLIYHWGVYDIRSRLDIIKISPPNETVEYIQNYVSLFDLFLIGVFFIILIYLKKVLVKRKCPVKTYAMYIFSIAALIILQNQYPLKYIKFYIQAEKRAKLIEERRRFLAKHKIEPLKKQLLYKKVIICIGESAHRGHHQIYSYNRATTPCLNQLRDLLKLQAIASANQTEYAVPTLLTDADAKNWLKGYTNSFSLISYFKSAGFDTFWISNQGYGGKHDTYVTFLAQESNHTTFLNFSGNKTFNDSLVLEYLSKYGIKRGKALYIFHLAGSHFQYASKYPKTYMLIKKPRNIVDEYDNSIYFTDLVLYKILQSFQDNNETLLFIYVSDHGEVVDLNLHGHGFLPPYKREYEVPLLIYSSIKNSRINYLKDVASKKIINTASLPQIVKYLTGIEDELNISFSKAVFALDPKNIFLYDDLRD